MVWIGLIFTGLGSVGGGLGLGDTGGGIFLASTIKRKKKTCNVQLIQILSESLFYYINQIAGRSRWLSS